MQRLNAYYTILAKKIKQQLTRSPLKYVSAVITDIIYNNIINIAITIAVTISNACLCFIKPLITTNKKIHKVHSLETFIL